MRLRTFIHNTFKGLARGLLLPGFMMASNSKVPFYVVAVYAAGTFSFWLGGQSVQMDPAEVVAARAESKGRTIPHVELAPALRDGSVEVVLKGNGRERLALAVRNGGKEPLKLRVPAGQIFTSAESSVILLRSREIELEPGKVERVVLETAAVHAGVSVMEATFTLSEGSIPKLARLIAYLERHPEISTAAAQTAVLALTDNLPVSAFATFAPVGGAVTSILDTTPFRVDVADIVSALLVLRELGVPPASLALTVDPQLRIEAMIDPLAHALAMRYYGIAPAREWEYWKWELSSGNEATRHYALFGIARFFPDVALEMLPRWVRETRTNRTFRMSAIQALAETGRPEALATLRELAFELGSDTSLGRTAREAADYVSRRAQRDESQRVAVAFRAGDPHY